MHLQWLPIQRLGEHVGDILAAFELLSEELRKWPPYGQNSFHGVIRVPSNIAPKKANHTIEVRSMLVMDPGVANQLELFPPICTCISAVLLLGDSQHEEDFRSWLTSDIAIGGAGVWWESVSHRKY